TRNAITRRTSSRSGRSTTRTMARSHARATPGSVSWTGRTCSCRRARSSWAGGSRVGPRTPRRWLGRPAVGRGAGAAPVPGGPGPGVAAGAAGRVARPGAGRGRAEPHPRRDPPERRAPLRIPDAVVTDGSAEAALDRYLASLAARDTSVHTQRSYAA